jgi:hypothetical protein
MPKTAGSSVILRLLPEKKVLSRTTGSIAIESLQSLSRNDDQILPGYLFRGRKELERIDQVTPDDALSYASFPASARMESNIVFGALFRISCHQRELASENKIK